MSEEVQPSTAALGALVFIRNYSQPLELLLSWTALDLGTPEDRRVFGERNLALQIASTTCSVVVQMSFF